MPFGISSAPEVFQRRMHEVIEGLQGVEVVADDLVVVGFGDWPVAIMIKIWMQSSSAAKRETSS